jgi:phosphate transport system permease protein
MSEQTTYLPEGEAFKRNLVARHTRATIWGRFFGLANVVALIALIAIFLNIVNQTFGYVAIKYTVEPATLSERPLEELGNDELAQLLVANMGGRVRVVIRDQLSMVEPDQFTTLPISRVLEGRVYPAERADLTINDLTEDEWAAILSANLSQSQLLEAVHSEIVKPQISASWRLFDSVVNRAAIEAEVVEKYPDARLEFRSWLSTGFVSRSISSSPITAGLRTALLGSLWIIGITILVALPLGVGAAIYLEEYAKPNRINRLIETNIRNLAGVPSIIYGMLGLAVFVRVLGDVTSGAVFGVTESNGRTVLSAGLTMALLIMPVIIINSQEAIRAVPRSIREASYGVGATQWQTIWNQVLPAAIPGILTGIILSMSRAVGETAPLIVVGASTFIGIDPNGPFSKFTVVPIQIYQWTSRPELEFKNTAAAAIIVLLILLLILNGTAIFLRQRFSRRLA